MLKMLCTSKLKKAYYKMEIDEKVQKLATIIENHFHCRDMNHDFLVAIADILEDIAYDQESQTWIEFNVIKELKHWIDIYEYDSLSHWHSFAPHVPIITIGRTEAESYSRIAIIEAIKSMMLLAASKIHPIFHRLMIKQVDSLIPSRLVNATKLDNLYEFSALIENTVKVQAESVLKQKGFSSWDEWESSLKREHSKETKTPFLRAV